MLFTDITLFDEQFQPRAHQYLATEGNRIAYIGSERPAGDFGQTYNGQGKALLPGFYNAHCHIPMTLLRGYGEGLPLDRWLNERVFPFEDLLTADDMYWGAMIGIAEQLASGAVSFTDMYMEMPGICRAVTESGIKANLSHGGSMFDPNGRFADCGESKGLAYLLDYVKNAGNDRIIADISIHAEYTTHEAFIREVVTHGQKHGLRMHLHLSETQKEHEECKARHNGMTPAQYFASCGVFTLPTTAAHCVWVEEADMDLLAKHHVFVAHCPSSNLKLGSGIAPITQLRARGVQVAIGTDGASSNNNLNMMEEITLAGLVQKGANHDPMCLPPHELLEMGCHVGALSQGRTDCGVLKTGNRADLIVMDLERAHMHPIYDVSANLLFSGQGSDVVLTMVDGDVLYRDGKFAHIDLERVLTEVERIKTEKLAQLAKKTDGC